MDPISTWTAVSAEELRNNQPIAEKKLKDYTIEVYCNPDSLWLVAIWPSGGKLALRLLFSQGGELTLNNMNDAERELFFELENLCGNYEVLVDFDDFQSPFFRFTTKLRTKFAMLLPYCPKDLIPLTKAGKVQEAGVVHASQVGTRSALMHFSMTRPTVGSVFYFQNLTELNPYFETTKTSGKELMGGSWPELGFSLPPATESPLPKGGEFVISDGFVRLSEETPTDDFQICEQFMDHLAAVYKVLSKPEPTYQDWTGMADKGLTGLYNHKGCWTFAGGHPYLNAYVADYKSPPEIMVQLATLVPMIEYCNWRGIGHQMIDEIRNGLPAFYDEKLRTVVRWLPALKDNLDGSEEQKEENVMDAWYLHHPLTNLVRLAKSGDGIAEELVMKSVDYAIKVAKHFKYEWPVFYRMDTFEVLKEETAPGKGGEKDVPGAYAKLMLEIWSFKKEDKYFNEAKEAVKLLKGLSFDLFYQANNTAFSAVALLRLYKETGDDSYLKLSYCCIAAIFKNVHLWDCNYGNGAHFPYFFSVFPLSDAPYTAAYEEQEVYSTLHGYLQEAEGIEILPSVRLLIAEFVKYAIARMPYYFPPMLPKEVLSEEIKTGEIDPSLWIPIEDVSDGLERFGSVGQEVYGACIAFGIVPRQYFKAKDAGFTIFTDYPAMNFKIKKNSLSLQILGEESQYCNLVVLLEEDCQADKFTLKNNPSLSDVENQKDTSNQGQLRFQIRANQQINMTWNIRAKQQ